MNKKIIVKIKTNSMIVNMIKGIIVTKNRNGKNINTKTK